MTELNITVRNTSDVGGTFLTPVYFGFHDGSFDLFDVNQGASRGLEALAEDGTFSIVGQERRAADGDSQGLVVTGNGAPPIATQEITSATIDVDALSNGSVTLAAMLLPSNDAFIGTETALELFDAEGNFLGAQLLSFAGSDVYDAGTELNTELDAAFLNQTAPNTGDTEFNVVRLHEGFNGSEGNPTGEGEQNILGGTNAFGIDIDVVAADFTRDGAEIADIHINTLREFVGTASADTITGGIDDDLVDAQAGDDVIFTGRGWDVIHGGLGDDTAMGGRGVDRIYGEDGNDNLDGGLGDDVISGGVGNDILRGAQGDDHFVFAEGDGVDFIKDFNRAGDDTIILSMTGIDTFADVLSAATEVNLGTFLDFGSAGGIELRGVAVSDLTETDFLFG